MVQIKPFGKIRYHGALVKKQLAYLDKIAGILRGSILFSENQKIVQIKGKITENFP